MHEFFLKKQGWTLTLHVDTFGYESLFLAPCEDFWLQPHSVILSLEQHQDLRSPYTELSSLFTSPHQSLCLNSH